MTTLLIAIFITVFDQLVKWIVVSHMELGETIPLIRNVFHLTYILNPGAAFGLLPPSGLVFPGYCGRPFRCFFRDEEKDSGKAFLFPRGGRHASWRRFRKRY